jgi:hypothetical protein
MDPALRRISEAKAGVREGRKHRSAERDVSFAPVNAVESYIRAARDCIEPRAARLPLQMHWVRRRHGSRIDSDALLHAIRQRDGGE